MKNGTFKLATLYEEDDSEPLYTGEIGISFPINDPENGEGYIYTDHSAEGDTYVYERVFKIDLDDYIDPGSLTKPLVIMHTRNGGAESTSWDYGFITEDGRFSSASIFEAPDDGIVKIYQQMKILGANTANNEDYGFMLSIVNPHELSFNGENTLEPSTICMLKADRSNKEYVLDITVPEGATPGSYYMTQSTTWARYADDGLWKERGVFPIAYTQDPDDSQKHLIAYIGKLDRDILFNWETHEEAGQETKATIREIAPEERDLIKTITVNADGASHTIQTVVGQCFYPFFFEGEVDDRSGVTLKVSSDSQDSLKGYVRILGGTNNGTVGYTQTTLDRIDHTRYYPASRFIDFGFLYVTNAEEAAGSITLTITPN